MTKYKTIDKDGRENESGSCELDRFTFARGIYSVLNWFG